MTTIPVSGAPSRPNIVFILADQLRADAIGCYGGTAVPTPNIDRLAAGGTRYANAVSASPLCVPARTALLTGMNAMRNGVLDNLSFLRPDHADLGIDTWPEMLAASGYRTASIGKMHFYPWDASLGFGERVTAEDKTWPLIRDDYHDRLAAAGLRKESGGSLPTIDGDPLATVNPLPRELTADGFVGDQACRYLENADLHSPFALMIGFPGPHDPYDPRVDSLARVDGRGIAAAIPGGSETADLAELFATQRRNQAARGGVDYSRLDAAGVATMRRHYAALVGQIDDEIGRIIDVLEERGLLRETVVILASDHGDHLGDHGFANAKNTYFESAIRVPVIVSGPGAAAGAARHDLVELRDVTATILAAAGIDQPPHMDAIPLPGLSYRSQVDGPGRSVVVGILSHGFMVFDGRVKLHTYRWGRPQLYDLSTDPDEQVNLADDPRWLSTLLRLQGELTSELAASIGIATADRNAGESVLELVGNVTGFGGREWQRTFPHPLSQRRDARTGEQGR